MALRQSTGVIFVFLGRFYRADRAKEQVLVKPLGESDSPWDAWHRKTAWLTIIFGFILITTGIIRLTLAFLVSIGWISPLPSFL